MVTILGVTMFLFGAAMFSYSGPTLSPIISDLGKYSFFLWLPTLILGLSIFTWPQKQKKV